jgi:hypothetical protein
MINTKVYRDCARVGRAELIERIQKLCAELDERTNGLNLPGWFCPGCGVFNGEVKEKHETCRACDALFLDMAQPRPLELCDPVLDEEADA